MASEKRYIAPATHPVTGTLTVPGGKSAGIRALLLAAFSEGISHLEGIPVSRDLLDAQNALEALGAYIHDEKMGKYIEGFGAFPPKENGIVPVGNSGATARFLTAFLSLCYCGEWTITSGEQLSKRPIMPLIDALWRWGADIHLLENPNGFPIHVIGKHLQGKLVTVSAKESSQFASALLMAAPLAAGETIVAVYDADPEEAYFTLTMRMMRLFGTEIEEITGDDVKKYIEVADRNVRIFRIVKANYHGTRCIIPADANTANYFFAAAALTGGSVSVSNLNRLDETPGVQFVDVFARMGCKVSGIILDGITVSGMENIEGLRIKGARLQGGFELDMCKMAESAPTLAVMACFADAPVTMRGLAHIRGHETDRLAALAALLPALGAGVEEYSDGLTIIPQGKSVLPDKPIQIDPRDDHRLAMAFAVGGFASAGVEMLNPQCVSKTFPDFYERLIKTIELS